jgi:hypothetical protein
MSFGAHHYVPILKMKRGEKAALRLLPTSVREKITPLLEIVVRKTDRTVDEHLDNAFKGLDDAVEGFGRCFIDTHEIALDGAAVVTEAFQRAERLGIAFTPVTGISRTVDVAAALEHRTRGLALRLTRKEFEKGNLGAGVRAFLDQHGLTPENIDLIIDLGSVDQMVTFGIQALSNAFLADVPDHTRWKTFTLSACAFPPGMGAVDRHSHDFIDRSDWLAWRDGLHARRTSMARMPTYSDGAIQHPKGVEGFDPRKMQAPAAIRYTTGESWLLIKGESLRRAPGTPQFRSLARQLVYDDLRSEFYGTNHCNGCAAIKNAADGVGKFGSLEAWRRWGTIHHITTVVQDLGALTWP